MAKVIEGLYYSESHEYVRVEGDFGYVGITDYAQHALGNVVYVDMPEVDDEVTAGEEFGAVESVKAASDLISPVSGTVVEVNEALEDEPELINQDAFENWIIKVELSDKADLDNLMDAAAYEAIRPSPLPLPIGRGVIAHANRTGILLPSIQGGDGGGSFKLHTNVQVFPTYRRRPAGDA